MRRRTTALLDTQDALFADPPTTPQPPTEPPRITKLDPKSHPRPPRRDPETRAQHCTPTCIACGLPEPAPGANYSRRCTVTRRQCATLCIHTSEPFKADICLVLTHTRAEILTSPHSGHTIAAVRDCPHCGNTHAHAPTPGAHYRISGCRKPYIVHITEGATA